MLMIFKHIFSGNRYQPEEIPSVDSKPAASFNPGDIIHERYCIQQSQIDRNRNWWNETYLAIDLDSPTRQQVVIKYLKLNLSGRERLKMAGIVFGCEMDKLAKISSKIDFIPQFYNCFQDRDEFYLVQEYIAGRNMADILDNVRLSEYETVGFIKEILSALQSVHHHDIIYKYLTLNSIVLRSRDGKLGFLYCGDIFSMIDMKPPEPSEQFINRCYFFERYKAPELLALRPQLSSDIYAIGAIAIQCLVGCSLYKLTECPSSGEIKWREHCQVSDRFANILNKMYEPVRRYRYSNVAEVLEAIDRVDS